MRRQRLILGLSLALAACDDDQDAPSILDGGLMDANAAKPGDGGEADVSLYARVLLDSASATLCFKYGGAANVEKAIKQDVLFELATDCRIGPHVTTLPADHLARLGDCLAIQAQELFGCPGIKYAGSMSPNGLPCRGAASADLGLASDASEALLFDIARGLANAGVAREDVRRVAPSLAGVEGDVAETPASVCLDGGTSDAHVFDASP